MILFSYSFNKKQNFIICLSNNYYMLTKLNGLFLWKARKSSLLDMDKFLAFHRKTHLISHIPSLGEIWKHTTLWCFLTCNMLWFFTPPHSHKHTEKYNFSSSGFVKQKCPFGFRQWTFSTDREEFSLILSCNVLHAYSLK